MESVKEEEAEDDEAAEEIMEEEAEDEDSKGLFRAELKLDDRLDMDGPGTTVPRDDDSASAPLDSDSDSETDSDAEPEPIRRSLAPSPTDSLAARAAAITLNPEEEEAALTPDGAGASPSDGNDDDDGAEVTQPEKPVGALHGRTDTISIKERVASDIVRHNARQSKYHSKRTSRKIGRPRGSKAKQDTRIKLGRGTDWD